MHLVYATKAERYVSKYAIQGPGHWADNCKMVYSVELNAFFAYSAEASRRNNYMKEIARFLTVKLNVK